MPPSAGPHGVGGRQDAKGVERELAQKAMGSIGEAKVVHPVAGVSSPEAGDPAGSTSDGQPGSDEPAIASAETQHATEATGMKAKPRQHSGENLKYTGNGCWSRTIMGAQRLVTTSCGGPSIKDTIRRKIRDVHACEVIDECEPENAPDRVVHRELKHARGIRIEVQVRQSDKLFGKYGPDVSKVFSPPRVVHDAGVQRYLGLNLHPGWSLDLAVVDPISGMHWDFIKPAMGTRARELVIRGRPHTLLCSPTCTPFSRLQHLSQAKRDPKVVAQELRDGIAHMIFCVGLANIQRHSGRYCVIEQPAEATSWSHPQVVSLLADDSTYRVEFDMCR